MRLRPYIHKKDFGCIRRWIDGERVHSLWCADRTPYPPEAEDFWRLLIQEENENEGSAFTAVTDEGRTHRLFCIFGRLYGEFRIPEIYYRGSRSAGTGIWYADDGTHSEIRF